MGERGERERGREEGAVEDSVDAVEAIVQRIKYVVVSDKTRSTDPSMGPSEPTDTVDEGGPGLFGGGGGFAHGE